MAKHVSGGMSAEEWESTPITFGAKTMARVMGCNVRFVQNNGKELGGRMLAGKWIFSKPRVAALVGIEGE